MSLGHGGGVSEEVGCVGLAEDMEDNTACNRIAIHCIHGTPLLRKAYV